MLAATVASARSTVVDCPGGLCVGTNGNDRINESSIDDDIFGLGGKDRIRAQLFGGFVDDVNAGQGNDRINTNDGDRLDSIRCGQGFDVVRSDRGDDIINKGSCERINGGA